MKAILTTKTDSFYDDIPEIRYHFPKTYLKQITAAVGDQIIYYSPTKDKKSGHVHWMFDRGLISFGEEYELPTAVFSYPMVVGRGGGGT